jgi:hypothetical protein
MVVLGLVLAIIVIGWEDGNIMFSDSASKELGAYAAINIRIVERDFKEELCNVQLPWQDMGLAANNLRGRNR